MSAHARMHGAEHVAESTNVHTSTAHPPPRVTQTNLMPPIHIVASVLSGRAPESLQRRLLEVRKRRAAHLLQTGFSKEWLESRGQ